MRKFLPSFDCMPYLVMWLLFAGAVYQLPLFSSNQNAYFLSGMARAGYGYLAADWLANQTDHVPAFSTLVALVHTYCSHWLYQLVFGLLALVYAASLSAIVVRTYAGVQRLQPFVFFFALLTLFHCAWMLTPIADVFPHADRLVTLVERLTKLATNGVAGQSILRPYLQPSTFGVLLLTSVACFLYRREGIAVVMAVLAASVHPTFVLHAAILTAVYMLILLTEHQPRKALGIGALAALMMVPIVMYVVLVLQPTSPHFLAKAQSILVEERIPQHAKISVWFNRYTLVKVAIVVAGIAASWRNRRLFLVLAIATGVSVGLTLLQMATGSTSLALLFPWRLSTWLTPTCLALLLGWATDRAWQWLDGMPRRGARLCQQCLVLLSVVFIAASCYRGLNRTVSAALAGRQDGVIAMASQNAAAGQTYLVPLRYEDFRLASGIPVFIDWKSHPYRYEELIEWRDRVQLARAFYQADSSEAAERALADIQAHAAVTHIIVDAGQAFLVAGLAAETEFSDSKHILVKLK